ncbi:TPA: hypothetical protein ACYHTU_002522 [Vibrio cholerae]
MDTIRTLTCENKPVDIPVLLLTFDRLDCLPRMIDVFREVRVKKLYVSSDGGRDIKETKRVQLVRKWLSTNIDWPCEVVELYQNVNLGCKKCVDTSVKAFFSKEQKGIVLEDDCIPTLGFFQYVKVMLEKYEKNYKVGAISGRMHTNNYEVLERDYFFSKRFYCWGWASWSDRVLDIDVDFPYNNGFLSKVGIDTFREYIYLLTINGLMKTKQVNSWAYSYEVTFRLRGQYCIIPRKNMVSNIGFAETGGTHSATWFKDHIPVHDSFSLSDVDKQYNLTPEIRYDEEVLKEEQKWLFRGVLIAIFSHFGNSRVIFKKVKRLIYG